MTSFSLRSVKLRPGEQHRDAKEIELAPIELGGQRYLPVPGTVEAELTLSRASTGTVFELRFPARVHGPCLRCLTDAVVELPISAREYQAASADAAEELRTPYVVDNQLRLSDWAHDALILALPDKILCRADCAGLCGVCGRDLNYEPHEHVEDVSDARWAALADLRERL